MITSDLLEAYLACPMKCYLQSNGAKCSENTFAALYQTQKDSYRHASIRRLEADLSQRSTRDQIEPRRFNKARWQFALHQVFDVDDLSANIHAILRGRIASSRCVSAFTAVSTRPMLLIAISRRSRNAVRCGEGQSGASQKEPLQAEISVMTARRPSRCG
jgi:hypothetical protein